MSHDNVNIFVNSLKQIQHDTPFYMSSRPQNINGTVGFVYYSWLNMALTNENDLKMYCLLSLVYPEINRKRTLVEFVSQVFLTLSLGIKALWLPGHIRHLWEKIDLGHQAIPFIFDKKVKS